MSSRIRVTWIKWLPKNKKCGVLQKSHTHAHCPSTSFMFYLKSRYAQSCGNLKETCKVIPLNTLTAFVRKTVQYKEQPIFPINSFFASGDFWSLLITFANSLDPDQDRLLSIWIQIVWQAVNERIFWKRSFWRKKSQQTTTKEWKN